jgi:nucleotide-binding universal stress UspA family protein
MFHHILVPLDGSPRAEQALPIAARLVRASGGTLTVLRVVTPLLDMDIRPVSLIKPMELTQEADIARANQYLAQVASSDDLRGIAVQTEALTGTPTQAILLFGECQHVDLVVMCSHGQTGPKRWRLGSVAQRVAWSSPVPVLVLHNGGAISTVPHEDRIRPLRVLVALDGSPVAEEVLMPAAHLCTMLAAPDRGALHLTHVLQQLPARESRHMEGRARAHEQTILDARAYLSVVAQRLREECGAASNLLITSSVVAQPDVADTLLRVAEHGELTEDVEEFDGCDVIAMATHGRGAPSRWIIGSVTERVLSATFLPLLIVRSHRLQAQEETKASEAAKRGTSCIQPDAPGVSNLQGA